MKAIGTLRRPWICHRPQLLSVIANNKSWDGRKGSHSKADGEEEVKGEARHLKFCWPVWEANQLL
jgi:hypothetical protein